MKIFLSWSGERSRMAALTLYNWLPNVIQSIEPFISCESISKGVRWGDQLAIGLEQAEFGIICLTKENINSPWILFEAGALSKIMTTSFVCPLLIDLTYNDIKGSPLSQFQTTTIDNSDFRKLILTINSANRTSVLNEKTVESSFEKWWSDLETTFTNINNDNKHSSSISKVMIALPQKNIDPHKIDAVLNATKTFMEALGLHLDFEEPPKFGSFYQKLKFIFQRQISEKEVESVFNTAKQALELKEVGLPTSQQTEKLANAAEKIIAALESVESGVVRLGQLLVIKTNRHQIKIVQLSPKQLEKLDVNPRLLQSPEDLYNYILNEEDGTKMDNLPIT